MIYGLAARDRFTFFGGRPGGASGQAAGGQALAAPRGARPALRRWAILILNRTAAFARLRLGLVPPLPAVEE
jgi:hypothetical protein